MTQYTYQQRGDTVPVTAPSGGVEAGDYFLVGATLCVAANDAAATDEVEAFIAEVHKLAPADNTTAFGENVALYWNDTDGKLFNDADGGTGTGHPFVGICVGGKAESATTCSILLIPSA